MILPMKLKSHLDNAPLILTPLLLLITLLLISTHSVFAQSIPTAYSIDRYENLRKNLPFGKPTVIETEAPKAPPFTSDLTLVGYSKVGSGYFVTLLNKKNQQRIQLTPKESPDGIKVVEVKNPSDITKVEINLKKGDEIGKVTFDPLFLNPAPNQGMTPPPIDAFTHNPQIMNSQNPQNVLPPPPQNPEVPVQNLDKQSPTNNVPPAVRRIRRVIVPTQAP